MNRQPGDAGQRFDGVDRVRRRDRVVSAAQIRAVAAQLKGRRERRAEPQVAALGGHDDGAAAESVGGKRLTQTRVLVGGEVVQGVVVGGGGGRKGQRQRRERPVRPGDVEGDAQVGAELYADRTWFRRLEAKRVRRNLVRSHSERGRS